MDRGEFGGCFDSSCSQVRSDEQFQLHHKSREESRLDFFYGHHGLEDYTQDADEHEEFDPF